MDSYHLHILIYLAFDNHAYFTSDPAFTSVHSGMSLLRYSQVYPSIHLFGGHLFDVFMANTDFLFLFFIFSIGYMIKCLLTDTQN